MGSNPTWDSSLFLCKEEKVSKCCCVVFDMSQLHVSICIVHVHGGGRGRNEREGGRKCEGRSRGREGDIDVEKGREKVFKVHV